MIPSSASDSIETEVQFLKGVGPKWANVLAKLGLRTVRDVLFHFPRRYEDRTNLPPIRDLEPGQHATIRGRILAIDARPTRGRRGMVLLSVTIHDGTGSVVLQWFNQPWLRRRFEEATKDVIAYGFVKKGNRGLEMNTPEVEFFEGEDEIAEFAKITPVYSLSEGVPQWLVRKAAHAALDRYVSGIEDPLPTDFRREHKLQPLVWALRNIHLPESESARASARKRLVFEEFFYNQVAIQMRRRESQQEMGISFPISQIAGVDHSAPGLFGSEAALKPDESLWDEVHRLLPFSLTGAQRRVIDEIWRDMERPSPMNRLVQGDVGSGKTAVAAAAMLAAVRCGYQAALMAPTEILAEQHYINLHNLFDRIGLKTELLVSKLKVRDKRRAQLRASAGESSIFVGTTSLIQDSVGFHKLGLVVIDEQHRFGVMQRAALRQKGTNPDVLVMTATPIPRTLTMTLFGDLDLSIIDELPPGRKPIRTHWKLPNERAQVLSAVRKLLDEGRQAYFVCPMISDSDKMEVQAAVDLHYRLVNEDFPDKRVGLLHGAMKPVEKEEIMLAFRAGELDILVSTVVIEVGVDVPNASVMVIEDANRFGLAQLHQLRGRVGRGEHQSFCILMGSPTNDEARARLTTMTETTDGFKIAEVDLRLRGPGEVAGTKQSGNLDLKLADLVQDSKLLETAREAAIQLLDEDPQLERPEHQAILRRAKESRLDLALVTIS